MSKIFKRIEAVMTGESKGQDFFFESSLFMASFVYGTVVKIRETLYKKGVLRPKRLPCTVISIGNLAVGGTGKTPMTIKVAELVKYLGYKVVVVSRGYMGKAEKRGGIVSNGQTVFMGPDAAGDEPFMMATKLKNIPVVVGRNRFKAGMKAVKRFSPDVLVLDDAFQHIDLVRDIDIVLLDCSRPFGNMHLLPRGILREPVSSLSRGDVFILTKSDSFNATPLAQFSDLTDNRPVFKSFHVPNICKVIKGKSGASQKASRCSSRCNMKFLKGRKAFAFSGIARNNDFRRTVVDLKCDLAGFLEFPDHHPYSDEDINRILQSASCAKADLLLTTEKDYVRISHRIAWPIDLVVLGIKASCGDADNAFDDFIKERLTENRKVH